NQPVRQHAGIPFGVGSHHRADEPGYALFIRVARPVEGADSAVGAGYSRSLLHDAAARCVDQRLRLAWQTHHRNQGREFCDHRAVLGGEASRRRPAYQGADQHRVDHRPHPDQWAKRLRGGPRAPEAYKLTPLSAFGKSYTPPPGVVNPAVDTKTAPIDQVSKMDAATFFKALSRLMAANPPPPADAPPRALPSHIRGV